MIALLRSLSRGMALAWALFAIAGTAHGHAVVIETTPADGALVQAAPDQVVIRFNEPIVPVTAQVLNATGERVGPVGPAAVQGEVLRLTLPPTLAKGSYIASYRVISADSHPVGGSIVFSVGQVSERVTAPMGPADDSGWTAAMVVVRAILYTGILGGAGSMLFLLLVRPVDLASRTTALVTTVLAAGGSVAALLAIGIHGGQLTGGPVSSLMNASTWSLGLTSGFGAMAIMAMVGLALVVAGLRLHWPWIFRPLGYLGAAAALASFAVSGHVVTAGPRWITIPVLLTHTTAVAFWVGSLLPLHQAIGQLGAKAAPIVQRFSKIAVGAVAALVTAGLIIAVLQVQSFRGLVETAYGVILLAKLGSLAGLLSLAIINKVRLTPALARGEAHAGPWLRRTLAAEIALALSILVATAALGTTPPPRVLAAGPESHAGHMIETNVPHGAGLSVTILTSRGSAKVVLSSARRGINSLQITLLDSAGAVVQAQGVTFSAANPLAGVEPIKREAEAVGPNLWRVDDLLLVPAGEWSIRVDALVSDFEKVQFDTSVQIR